MMLLIKVPVASVKLRKIRHRILATAGLAEVDYRCARVEDDVPASLLSAVTPISFLEEQEEVLVKRAHLCPGIPPNQYARAQ